MFPRSTERGPIEARLVALRHKGTRQFPRSTERGPIEAKVIPGMVIFIGEFPRSTERGPIEAREVSFVTLGADDVSTLYRAWPH